MTDPTSTDKGATFGPEQYNELMRIFRELEETLRQIPRIDAILLTDRDYLIPRGAIYQLRDEETEKRYYAMNKRDFDEMLESGVVEKRVSPFELPSLREFYGIPVIEDSKQIEKIFLAALEKRYSLPFHDLVYSKPEVTKILFEPDKDKNG